MLADNVVKSDNGRAAIRRSGEYNKETHDADPFAHDEEVAPCRHRWARRFRPRGRRSRTGLRWYGYHDTLRWYGYHDTLRWYGYHDTLRWEGTTPSGEGAIIGLITKTESNPFFVKMREGAQAKADELGVELRPYAGEFDGDNEGQVTAIEDLISAGAAGFMITPERHRRNRADHRGGTRCRPRRDRPRHAARADRRG